MGTLRIVELLGDGIGAELRAATHAVAEVLPLEIEFSPVDLSLENREERGRVLYDEAIAAMRDTRLAIKYPTITKTESPNAVLRRGLEFSVIHRPVFSIPGVESPIEDQVDLDIVRVATGGTYEDPGRMIGQDAAVSLRIVERRPVRHAARFSFRLAKKHGLEVTSTSKHTIQRITDGLFESVVLDVAAEFPGIAHRVELFDALLAKIILRPGDFQVILCLNEYGDFLSDMACGLVGSMGLGASASYSFTEQSEPDIAMFDPAGGTAPDIAGQDKCNPSASLLALSMLLSHIDRPDLGAAVRKTILDLIGRGECTADLGGELSTTDFTAAVADGVRGRLTAGA